MITELNNSFCIWNECSDTIDNVYMQRSVTTNMHNVITEIINSIILFSTGTAYLISSVTCMYVLIRDPMKKVFKSKSISGFTI